MKIFYTLSIVCGLLFCYVLPASSQSKKTSIAPHRFESTDHTITFQYSAQLLLCQQDTPACQDYSYLCTVDQDTVAPIACLGYGGDAYKGYNYTGAALAIGILSSAKDEVACFDLPGTKGEDVKINGVVFKSSQDGDAGMGHFVNDFVYRTFHGGQCYEADLRIATTNFGNYDPGTVKEFKAADEQKVHRKLKLALETLHFSDVGK